MASAAYFDFTQSYDRVSDGGKTPVVVEVEGELAPTSSSKGELVLISPTISAYRNGACESTPLSKDDPLALANLLKVLKVKLDRFRAIPKGQVPYELEPPLGDLIGATGKEIRAALGRPDVCDSEYATYDDEDATVENCANSDEWAYFFCGRDPLMFGGCFGLEMEFNTNEELIFAKWQGYR